MGPHGRRHSLAPIQARIARCPGNARRAGGLVGRSFGRRQGSGAVTVSLERCKRKVCKVWSRRFAAESDISAPSLCATIAYSPVITKRPTSIIKILPSSGIHPNAVDGNAIVRPKVLTQPKKQHAEATHAT